MSSKHPIDALFEKELKEHKTAPSEAAWAKIAASQQGGQSKKGGWFFLRAASVLILVGLGSFWYLNRNANSLRIGDELESPYEIVAGPEVDPKTNKDEPSKASQTTEPKKQNPKSTKNQNTKPLKKAPAKKRAARVIPILQQSISDPVLAFNDLAPIEWDFGPEGLENIEEGDVLNIKVDLPDWKGDYQSEPKAKKDFRQRMWAYASNQYDRVIAGESLELPNTDDAKIEIPLPDFINRRFSK